MSVPEGREAGAGARTTPRVLNARGRKGIVPDGAVYIGRAVRFTPWQRTKWRNRFKMDAPKRKRDGTREKVVAKYRAWVCDQPDLMAAPPELRGRDLLYWYAPEACHGDILLEVLTAAHLDHAPENNDPANLLAGCQRCHNAYDDAERQRGKAERRRAAMADGDLFPERSARP